jgi:hypothetical protein
VSTETADTLRVLTIALGVVMVLLTLCVVLVYDFAVRVTNRDGTRFLPTHIVTIAASFVVFTGSGIAELVSRWGTPITWRLPFLHVALALATVAQAAMLRVVRAQIKEARRRG